MSDSEDAECVWSFICETSGEAVTWTTESEMGMED